MVVIEDLHVKRMLLNDKLEPPRVS